MQVLNARELECAEEGKVSYEIQWTIANWRQVRRDVTQVNNQKVTFETGLESREMIQTKWLIGLKNVPHRFDQRHNAREMARVYWQLLDIKGPGSESTLTLDAKLCTQLLIGGSTLSLVDEQSREVGLGEIIDERREHLDIGMNIMDLVDANWINANGAVEYKLVLTFKTPDRDSAETHLKKLKMEQFSKRSHDQLRENLGALLISDSNGDLKIITKDGIELSAHQSILKAQCPVFAGLLNSEFCERRSGIVKVDDISGKTMKILLHYFYTGDLLTGWSDHDTIVEFTYAAGKYQMNQVLELLDDLFGRGAQEEVSNLDVQLLNLAGKLSLKNAEARLLQRIIGKITAAKRSEDVFQLFGYDGEDISKNAEVLADEKLGESKALEILNCTLGVGMGNLQLEHFSQSGLILLALVQRMGSLSNLEQVLLKKFAEVTSTLASAEELFAFFGDGK